MLDPSGVRKTVELPVRVKVNSRDESRSRSLALLQQLGITLLADNEEVSEEDFATFLLPPRWTAEPKKKLPWTVIADSTGKDILLVYTAKTARNLPYVSICN